MTFAHDLLAQILTMQGCPEDVAQRAAVAVLRGMVASELVDERTLAHWERDARIYHLRGHRVSCVELALRFSISKRSVFSAIRAHQLRKRAAMNMVS